MLKATYRFYLGIALCFIAIMISLVWIMDFFWALYKRRSKKSTTKENDQPLTASRQPSPSPEENDQPLPASRQPSLDEDPDKITVLEDSETGRSRAKQNRPNSAFRKIYS
jgi:cytoskeletal protein RodZ